ncbi:hypothetical protein SanaruYs_36990 [Chryseotalea sanaruensis]|uniref:Uncharacterized protein n=1 Tax=Chryseotalea sanaruensis TaxID=2482724 RepID=A0A401UEW8_9BACT|nr:hypothetical protein [Chryseotalea sanaruensis]GCC53455.1 hypothetical protein SanaruYs_36990 [Chryseotalea sanaruensis]
MVDINCNIFDLLVSGIIKNSFIDKKWCSTYLLLILLLNLVGCNKSNNSSSEMPPVKQDTLVQSQELTTQLVNSNYLLKTEKYFLLINNDTSDFNCLISKSKEDRSYSMNLSFFAGYSSYAERLKELKLILPSIDQKYSLDSLKSIYLGRLIYYGDLAISVTKSYQEQYDTSKKIEDYEAISTFLMKTKLADDFNTLLKPYAVSIKKISAEKIFFATKTELLTLNKISYNRDSIPDKILDCMIWIKVGK